MLSEDLSSAHQGVFCLPSSLPFALSRTYTTSAPSPAVWLLASVLHGLRVSHTPLLG